MNRLEQVHETVRAALNALAAASPDWLLAQAEPGWFERYEARVEDYRLPKNKAERIQLGHEIGADGNGVLRAVYSQSAPGWLRDIPAVQVLRHVWIQQYVTIDDQLRWRTPDEQQPGTLRQISPCDTDAPHLITNVITAPSPGSDYEATGQVQESLASRELTPTVHRADKGYMSAHNLARADRRGIELLGPMMPDNAWQSAEGNGFAVSDFAIDWDNRVMTCPTGATSLPWASEIDQGGTPVIRVRFSMRDCRDCLSRDLCTRGTKADVSPCARERSRKLCNVPDRDKAPTNGSNATLTEQASRALSHKVSKASACGGRATAGTPRPISSTYSSPRR